MAISEMIKKLRLREKMSQEDFASIFSVSRQSVQKWENGTSTPEISKLVEISKHFDISLDMLVLERDKRASEAILYNSEMKPQYSSIPTWEFYAADIMTEYQQSYEEGLDIEGYKDLFFSVSKLSASEIKKKLGDVIFEIVSNAPTRKDYKYIEPSELEAIKATRSEYPIKSIKLSEKTLEDKIGGAWYGRICGCMLGKTVEGIRTNELVPFLKETGNYPMHRYIYRKDLTDEICAKYNYPLKNRCFADDIDGMPVDDDTNYVVLAQLLIEKYGRDFTPFDMSRHWLSCQPKDAYCTAERVAFCNFVKGYVPPYSAIMQNPYREWIGAQIRGDYFGYINPGNPELAAEMAWRDASISHIKNGIYGEMFASAMIACAAMTDNMEDIIRAGLAQIPESSRLYEDVMCVVSAYKKGETSEKCFDMIHEKYDEYTGHGWCHTNSNAMIVAASLLYGEGDYGKSICMAVQTGFDTDCNGATVGSVIGMAKGIKGVPEYWTEPIKNTLHTSIFGVGTVKISDCVKKTLSHVKC